MRILRLTALLALIALGPLETTAHATTDEDITAFHNSAYTYCEVSLLAPRWQISQYDTKARIGNHLRDGRTAVLQAELAAARQAAIQQGRRCGFYETGFTLTDAERLAAFWGTDLYNAKVMIEEKSTRGNQEAIRWGLTQAPPPGTQPVVDPETAALTAFWDSPYSQCDARLLATFWGIDYFESKVRFGNKIAAGPARTTEQLVKRAREQAMVSGATCHFYETPFNYTDAEALAALWGQPIEDVKARIVRQVIAGDADGIRRDVKRAQAAQATP